MIKEEEIVSSHDNRTVKFWDIINKNLLISNIKNAHRGYVSNVSRFNSNELNSFLVVSCCYDGDVKLWDRRNTSSVYYVFPNKAKDIVFKSYSFKIIKKNNSEENKNLVLTGGASEYLNFYKI